MTILVTGVSGFIGRAIFEAACQRDLLVRGVVRNEKNIESFSFGKKNLMCIQDVNLNPDWTKALDGVDVVIHCAASNHVMHSSISREMDSNYHLVNVHATLDLAKQAKKNGVKRFIFISSIKVHGENTRPGQPFSAEDCLSPKDAYSRSKVAAEIGLKELCALSGMEFVIIRPPIVYGVGVKGNFLSLIHIVNKQIPLPFGMVVNNRRSYVALENLVDLIFVCISHPNAANKVFLISDGVDLSTKELIQKIGNALNRKVFIIPIPVYFLIFSQNFSIRKIYRLVSWVLYKLI